MPLKPQAAYDKDRRTGDAVPQLQHRHFALIASILADATDEAFEPADILQVEKVTRKFADVLALSNPGFDRSRFMAAAKRRRPI